MQTLIKVVHIEALPLFALTVTFSDGTSGAYDGSHLLQRDGPMVKPLHDETYFLRVFVEGGVPTWPNGYDMAPDWLYREMQAAGRLRSAEAGE